MEELSFWNFERKERKWFLRFFFSLIRREDGIGVVCIYRKENWEESGEESLETD